MSHDDQSYFCINKYLFTYAGINYVHISNNIIPLLCYCL